MILLREMRSNSKGETGVLMNSVGPMKSAESNLDVQKFFVTAAKLETVNV